MRFVRAFLRMVPGLVLLFSGFVKIIDPVGGELILSGYLKVIHLDLPGTVLSIMWSTLSGIEMLTGIALITGFRIRTAIVTAFALIAFFTLLTLFLAIFNPVSDCGCFGEAVKLSNTGTFLKNIVLMAFVTALFLIRKNYIPAAPPAAERISLIVFAGLIVALSVYSFYNLPIFDFLQFKAGYDIKESLAESGNSGQPQFETVLIYKKGDEQKRFSVENLPDSTWSFVDSETTLRSGSSDGRFLRFSVSDKERRDITDSLLNIKEGIFLFTVIDQSSLSTDYPGRLREIVQSLSDKGIRTMILTSSQIDSLEVKCNFPKTEGNTPEICFIDYKTLVSINRTNTGVMLLKDGVVIKKWAFRRFNQKNAVEILKKDPDMVTAAEEIGQQLLLEILAAGFIILLFLMRQIFKIVFIKKLTEYAGRIEQEY